MSRGRIHFSFSDSSPIPACVGYTRPGGAPSNMSSTVPPRDRSFGQSVGSVLCAIAALLAWYGRPLRAEILGSAGGLLILVGVFRPSLLTRPSAWWRRFGRALAYV